ncbi:hypothetical protein COOONC_03138 [Cooperia oncophora]
MSDHDMPMEDADIERLLLEEPTRSDQIASMKASLDTLVGTVKDLACKNALQVPQQSTASSSAASNPAATEQLNRFEFENVDCHATFDPIAAAQARKDEQAAADAEGIPLDNPDSRAPRLVRKFTGHNESSAQLNAYMKLKTLRMEEDLTSYCVELEKITQIAYPGASEKELSRTRA